MTTIALPPCQKFLKTQSNLIASSYAHWTGKKIPLPVSAQPLEERLFYAPFCVLSSGTGSDPILNYGNAKTLETWEYSWEELTQTPGRLTAEAMEQDERARFLKQVKEKGFIEDYQGIRITKSGKRFRIQNATVWNLMDTDGIFRGQAAMILDVRGL